MIFSMTAFSSARQVSDSISVYCEIRACNSKALDISLRITSGYLSLEEKIKTMISERISRGRLDVLIQISDSSSSAVAFEVDGIRAQAYYNALVEISRRFSLKDPVPLQLLAGYPGVIKSAETEKDMDAVWLIVQQCLQASVCDLVAMRKREGDFIARDIRSRLDSIAEQLDGIEQQSRNLIAYYQTRLLNRIKQITQGIIDIDPGRMAQEAAFLADRSDISEEIVRSRSHILQFRKIMDSPEPAGRKLNFLLQEMSREMNTMGAKTENAAVSYQVVEVKTELEKIREQAQNIE